MERKIFEWLEGKCDIDSILNQLEWLQGRGETGVTCDLPENRIAAVVLLYGNRHISEDFYGSVSEVPLKLLSEAEELPEKFFYWVQTREGWILVLFKEIKLFDFDHCETDKTQSVLLQLVLSEENFIMTTDLASMRNHYEFLREKRISILQQTMLIPNVCKYIDEHLSDVEMSLPSVAKDFFVSESHLSKEFKRRLGISFSEYLIQRRIDTAKHLLKNRYVKVCDVARITGFNSQHYFCTVFKKRVGVTPSKYRENN